MVLCNAWIYIHSILPFKDNYMILCVVELVWHIGSIMDCHATARGSIPGGNGILTELHVLRK